MISKDEILELYNNNEYIDCEITSLKINRHSKYKIDTIYIQGNKIYDYYLVGYYHLNNGNYDYLILLPEDIVNVDLHDYLSESTGKIQDFEKFIEYLSQCELI